MAGGELDLAFLDLRGIHALAAAQGRQPLRRVVLMDHPRRHLPDVQVFLAHGEKDGDVPGSDGVALAEPGALKLAGDDLGQVMAEHMAHGIFCFDELHGCTSRTVMVSPGRTVPSRRTTAKTPSVGMTHLPARRRMAQSL